MYTQVIESLPVLELPHPNPPLVKGREQDFPVSPLYKGRAVSFPKRLANARVQKMKNKQGIQLAFNLRHQYGQ